MSAAPQPHLLDVEILEEDPSPTFIIKVDTATLDFDFLLCNEAFRKLGLRNTILSQDKLALLFRSWAQAVNHPKTEYRFAGRLWKAETAGRNDKLKIIRAEVNANHDLDQNVLAEYDDPFSRHVQEDGTQVPLVLKRNLTVSHEATLENRYEDLSARWKSLQSMMDMSDVGVFEYNPEGKLLHGNEAFYQMSSHPRNPSEHKDFSFMDLVSPEDHPLIMSMWNTLVECRPVTFEMRLKPRSGSAITQWVLASCVPILDNEGNLASIAGNTVDITAQKQAQAAQAVKFRRFAQLTPTAIYIFTPQTGLSFTNDQFSELTGYTHSATDQWEHFDFVADEDVESVKRDWANILKGDRFDGVQFRLKKKWTSKDGICSNTWVQSSSFPELDRNGKVISIMGILFDISSFKWAEDIQLRRIDEALEAKRQQENFIDMTSHELRNPLSAVVQCADSTISSLQRLPLLQDVVSDAKDLEVQAEIRNCIDSMQTIITCSNHQKRVVDDVLTLSRLDTNLILITPVRVEPAMIVRRALKMFEVECSRSDIKLGFRLDESFNGMEWVMLDPSRLLQVLINLLTNAIKYTRDRTKRDITVILGGSWTLPPKCEEVVFDEEVDRPDILESLQWGQGRKAYVWVKVVDTGCGMTIEEQSRLFAKFSQATPRTHINYGGSGLGLWISKSLTSLQGGAINVHSEKDVGSAFTFFVSARLAQPPAGTSTRTKTPELQHTSFSYAAMEAAKLNVLLVEDNLVNQRILKKQLQKLGWNVSVAGNGQQALDWLKESVYWRVDGDEHQVMGGFVEMTRDATVAKNIGHELDIILMDIEMPVMDGLTCTRRIRDYEQQGLLRVPRVPSSSSAITPPTSSLQDLSMSEGESQQVRIPILGISANARSEQIKEALASGLDDTISKPFRIPELWPRIQELVKRVAEDKE